LLISLNCLYFQKGETHRIGVALPRGQRWRGPAWLAPQSWTSPQKAQSHNSLSDLIEFYLDDEQPRCARALFADVDAEPFDYVARSEHQGLLRRVSREAPAAEARLEQLERQNAELRAFAERHLPHREFAKFAVGSVLFFAGVLLFQIVGRVPLISAGLGWGGLAISSSALTLSFLADLDWKIWKRARSTKGTN
jgi:hypothetical protein